MRLAIASVQTSGSMLQPAELLGGSCEYNVDLPFLQEVVGNHVDLAFPRGPVTHPSRTLLRKSGRVKKAWDCTYHISSRCLVGTGSLFCVVCSVTMHRDALAIKTSNGRFCYCRLILLIPTHA